LAIGNPTDPSSRFKKACDSGQWNVLVVDCRNHPNVLYDNPRIIPGAVTTEWIADRLDEYGDEDSPLFRARVSGQWPVQGADSLISLAWVERCQRRYPIPEGVKKGRVLGIDIAGLGGDLSVMWEITNTKATLLWWTVHKELMETTGKIVQTIREREPSALAIDDTGIGNGVSSRLLELQRWSKEDLLQRNETLNNCSILRTNFGSSPTRDKEKFAHMKDYLWWAFRETLMKGALSLPPDSELRRLALPKSSSLQQILIPIYEIDSSGKIRVYDKRIGEKEKTKALPVKSPDVAHGLILANHAWDALGPQGVQVAPTTEDTWLAQRNRWFQKQVAAMKKPRKKSDDIYGEGAYRVFDLDSEGWSG
jgi:hypothetical protein